MILRTRKKILVVLMTASLTITGIMISSGYTQERQEELQAPSAKRPTTTIDPGPSLRERRLGISVVADVSVSPSIYAGACPTTFTFKGDITVNKAATVYYRFIRSDNYRSQPLPLTFEKAGSQEVAHSWQTGAGTGSTLEGWAAIQIVAPIKFQSNSAYFKGNCSDESNAVLSTTPGTEPPTKDQSEK